MNKLDSSCLGKEFDAGGEAIVYQVKNSNLIAKIYHKNKLNKDKINKIKIMVDKYQNNKYLKELFLNKQPQIIWPTKLVVDKGKVIGYAMKQVKNPLPLSNLIENINIGKYKKSFFSFQDRVKISLKIIKGIKKLHQNHIFAGDLNDNNILITEDKNVYFIDSDSYQFKESNKLYKCNVAMPGFCSPNFSPGEKLNDKDDIFALGIIIFKLFYDNLHPFHGKDKKGRNLKVQQKINKGLYPHTSRNINPLAKFKILSKQLVNKELWELFKQTFQRNQRSRPSLTELSKVLKQYLNELKECPINSNHYYHYKKNKCPWCEYKVKMGEEVFPEPKTSSSTNKNRKKNKSTTFLKEVEKLRKQRIAEAKVKYDLYQPEKDNWRKAVNSLANGEL
ncbi:protein kinase domain-containing protein [Halanaerobacter jeridensis]|uniref:DNA-binding helix-hairpin-helix protein with protein kinase domain n=1 Tax=Halanaerobacter jeridensis TaxID=706427 RepID=A0A938XY35_9FIRM|nr:protein kinase [Halanaerobacter jeridensis]MBM7557792.1 DNA-binding helix-hairpin-helix protein with protein kinase domain [Halanaerobacter jeridensis]